MMEVENSATDIPISASNSQLEQTTVETTPVKPKNKRGRPPSKPATISPVQKAPRLESEHTSQHRSIELVIEDILPVGDNIDLNNDFSQSMVPNSGVQNGDTDNSSSQLTSNHVNHSYQIVELLDNSVHPPLLPTCSYFFFYYVRLIYNAYK